MERFADQKNAPGVLVARTWIVFALAILVLGFLAYAVLSQESHPQPFILEGFPKGAFEMQDVREIDNFIAGSREGIAVFSSAHSAQDTLALLSEYLGNQGLGFGGEGAGTSPVIRMNNPLLEKKGEIQFEGEALPIKVTISIIEKLEDAENGVFAPRDLQFLAQGISAGDANINMTERFYARKIQTSRFGFFSEPREDNFEAKLKNAGFENVSKESNGIQETVTGERAKSRIVIRRAPVTGGQGRFHIRMELTRPF